MATKNASPTGNDTTGDGTLALPYATYSKIISVGADGDIGEIADGIITEATYLTVDKALTFHGASKLGTILKSLNASRIVYFNNSKLRAFQNLTLENSSTVSGAANLVESSGASTNLSTTFQGCFLKNGRTGTIALGAGDYGLTLDGNDFLVNINTVGQCLNLTATAGNIEVTDNTFTITSGATASMNGIIRQASAATAGVITITGNTFNVDKGVYVIRCGVGGWATGCDFTDNTVNITATSYTRPVFELGNITGAASCKRNVITIAATTASSTPIQIRSTVGTGSDCIWDIEDNEIDTYNVDGYGIILGDEGGDVLSKKDAFNGSTIKGNIIKSGNYFGEAIGLIHSIMTGGNKNLFIEDNTVYNGGYGIVMKGTDAWTSGYVKGNLFVNCKYVIYPKGQKNIKCINNTIIGDNGNHSKGILPGDLGSGDYATGTDMRNNVFKINTGYAVYVEANCQTGITLDYNCYHLTGTAKAAMINGVEYATLADLQAAGYETHGVSGDPSLKADYTIDASSIVFEKGIPIKGVHRILDTTGNNEITLVGGADFSLDSPYRKRTLVS